MDRARRAYSKKSFSFQREKRESQRCLQGVFKYCLKPELLADESAFDRTQQPDIHGEQARDRPDTGFIAPERVGGDANQLS